MEAFAFFVFLIILVVCLLCFAFFFLLERLASSEVATFFILLFSSLFLFVCVFFVIFCCFGGFSWFVFLLVVFVWLIIFWLFVFCYLSDHFCSIFVVWVVSLVLLSMCGQKHCFPCNSSACWCTIGLKLCLSILLLFLFYLLCCLAMFPLKWSWNIWDMCVCVLCSSIQA